jgi:hypothetical protein
MGAPEAMKVIERWGWEEAEKFVTDLNLRS